MLPSDDEDLLIARVQFGDTAAFEPLVDLHLPHLRAFVALKLPVSHLVDEVAHEAFVFAYRHIATFEVGTSFRAWLRAIAWNLVRAEIQRFSREQANQARYAEARLATCVPAENPRTSREADFLEECARELPSAMQRLLTLKYESGHSSEEIAAQLQRSIAWVRVTLFRVRQQLRLCIDGKTERDAHAR